MDATTGTTTSVLEAVPEPTKPGVTAPVRIVPNEGADDILQRWMKTNKAMWMVVDDTQHNALEALFVEHFGNAGLVIRMIFKIGKLREEQPDLEGYDTPTGESDIRDAFDRLGRALRFDVFKSKGED